MRAVRTASLAPFAGPVKHVLLWSCPLLLAGCGGATPQGNPAPPASAQSPTPTPAPQPAPTPTPTPAAPPPPVASVNYDSAEYRRSPALARVSALDAWKAGATGKGVTVGVVDSGIDQSTGEFSGRIHAASRDVVANRGLVDRQGHGTLVATVLGAARNDALTQGIAFDATLLIARTDSTADCSALSGCTHFDSAIADGVDLAANNGARAINISLGGSAATGRLQSAVQRATTAGSIVVIAAGNDGAAQPDPFPQSLAQAGGARGLVIIAGSTDVNGQISSFSDRAGDLAASFLTAPGEAVASVSLNGQQVTASGTSFAAPHIVGAIAILAQAYPNLSATQLVDLLYSSADDLGAPGVDPIYGRGGLNLARAFQPQGSTALAGGAPAGVSLTGANVALGGAMGNGAQLGTALKDVVVLDRFGRPFRADLSSSVRAASARLDLVDRLRRAPRVAESRSADNQLGLASVGEHGEESAVWARFGLAQLAPAASRPPAARLGVALGERTIVAAGLGIAADALLPDALVPTRAPRWLAGDEGDPFAPAATRGQFGLGVARRIAGGRTPLTLFVRAAQGPAPAGRLTVRDSRLGLAAPKISTASLALEGETARQTFKLATGFSRETGSLLGGVASPGLGLPLSATSLTLSSAAGWRLGERWRLGLAGDVGATRPGSATGGALTQVGTLLTSRFSIDMTAQDLLARGDSFGLRLTQPLRVERGSATFALPVDYDLMSGLASLARRTATLAPTGRELSLEAAYRRPVADGVLEASVFGRRQPGHVATAAPDAGAVLRWRTDF